MSEIFKVDINSLKPHPRNEEFFSNIDGEEFNRLVESIKDNGILTPLRVSEDMTIISGHQRYRASKVVGLTEVPIIISKAIDNNNILIELIASNFGRVKNDPIKQANWIKEYEELKGVRHGGERASGHNVHLVTQDDIANELGVDSRTLRRLKDLLKLDPSIQTLISEGQISATTGFKMISKLSEEEQLALVEMLPDNITKKLSSKQVQEYIDIIHAKDNKLEEVVHEKDAEIQDLEKQLAEAKEFSNGEEQKTEQLNKEIEQLRSRVKSLEHTNNSLVANGMKREEVDEKRKKECFNETAASITQMNAVIRNQLQKNSEILSQIGSENIMLLKSVIKQAMTELERLKDTVA